jgi:hypothetical protein
VFLLTLLMLAAPQGRPLFYWGAREAVIQTGAAGSEPGPARVVEVHASRDGDWLRLRFAFDRRVAESLYQPDGTPVSGRLSATLYFDRDDDRASGLTGRADDGRTGAELRLELGVLSVGADPEEKLEARAVVTAALYSLAPDGRRRQLWQRDDAANPDDVSAHGEFVELRLPLERAGLGGPARLILAVESRTWEGRCP